MSARQNQDGQTRNPKPQVLFLGFIESVENPEFSYTHRSEFLHLSRDVAPVPRQSLGGGRQKSIPPQDSCFQRWKFPLKAMLKRSTPSITLAWYTNFSSSSVLRSSLELSDAQVQQP